MGMMSRLYTDIQEMISLNCTEDQVIDFVVQEYGFSISEAQEMIAEIVRDDLLQNCNYAC
jgi:hypothetical protein